MAWRASEILPCRHWHLLLPHVVSWAHVSCLFRPVAVSLQNRPLQIQPSYRFLRSIVVQIPEEPVVESNRAESGSACRRRRLLRALPPVVAFCDESMTVSRPSNLGGGRAAVVEPPVWSSRLKRSSSTISGFAASARMSTAACRARRAAASASA